MDTTTDFRRTLLDATWEQLQTLSHQEKVLASVVTLSAGDVGAYYQCEGGEWKRAHAIGVDCDYAEQFPSTLPLTSVAEPYQYAFDGGQRLWLPVYDQDGNVKGAFVVDRLHRQAAEGWVTPYGEDRPEPEYAKESIDLAQVVSETFAPLCEPVEEAASERLRHTLTDADGTGKGDFYLRLREAMLEYMRHDPATGEKSDTLHSLHPPRVASMCEAAVQAFNATERHGLEGVTVRWSPWMRTLVELHDLGRVHAPMIDNREVYISHDAISPSALRRNTDHSFYTTVALNLPWLENDAHLVGNHHIVGRKPFNTTHYSEVPFLTNLLSVCDVFEAIVRRGEAENNRGSDFFSRALLKLGLFPEVQQGRLDPGALWVFLEGAAYRAHELAESGLEPLADDFAQAFRNVSYYLEEEGERLLAALKAEVGTPIEEIAARMQKYFTTQIGEGMRGSLKWLDACFLDALAGVETQDLNLETSMSSRSHDAAARA